MPGGSDSEAGDASYGTTATKSSARIGTERDGQHGRPNNRKSSRLHRIVSFLFATGAHDVASVTRRCLVALDHAARLRRNDFQHPGLREESHAPPDRSQKEKEITFDLCYSQVL